MRAAALPKGRGHQPGAPKNGDSSHWKALAVNMRTGSYCRCSVEALWTRNFLASTAGTITAGRRPRCWFIGPITPNRFFYPREVR